MEKKISVDQVNRWLSLIANVGVFVGLILVVVELGQSREMMRAQTRNEVAVQLVDLLSQVAGDPQLAAVIHKAIAGENLDASEQQQFRHRVLAMLRYFENVHYQYRQELYDEAEFSAQEEAWRRFLSDPPMATIWCEWRATFSPEFTDSFNSLMSEQQC